MNITRTLSGNQYLPLTCSREEFQRLVLSEIEQSENHFPFDDLIARIKSKCDFKKELNVNYLGTIEFQGPDLDFINETIWKQIWNKKLMIDFTLKRPYRNPDIFHFTKIHGQIKK